jgi:hypothetical protein
VIAAAELQKRYKIVHGNPEILTGNVETGETHAHILGDTTDSAARIVGAAIKNRVGKLFISDHDADNYGVASRIRDRLERKWAPLGHRLEVGRAAEVTTSDNLHILMYGFKRLPASGQSLEHLLEEAEREDAYVSLAHPELGDFSVTEQRVEDLLEKGLRFGLEVHNAGASQIDRAQKYPLPRSIRRRIPEAGSNDRAKVIFDKFQHMLHGATGGSDAHNARHIGDVVTCVPAGMDFFDAIREGKSVIMERERLPRTTVTNVLVGHVRGKMLDRKRQRGDLDVLVPQPV